MEKGLARVTLSAIFLALIAVGFFLIIHPFLAAITWAAILVTTTWPIYSGLKKLLRGRGNLASFLMVVSIAVLAFSIFIPLIAGLSGEAQQAASQVGKIQLDSSYISDKITWLPAEPRAAVLRAVDKIGSTNDQLKKYLVTYPEQFLQTLGAAAKGVAQAVLQFFLILFTAFFLYRSGGELGRDVSRAMNQIGGARFDNLLLAVKATSRSAVYGVLVTALAQGILAGIGYVVTGAPVPLLLGAATIVFSIIPFGTPLIYLPAAAAVWVEHGPVWGIALAVWGVAVVSNIDNVLRPLFISQATQMPLPLVFFGIIGGVLSFGLLGLVVGPVLMAVSLTLWREWISQTA